MNQFADHRTDVDPVSEVDAWRQLRFNCAVIDATRSVAAAYKPNMAFYRGDIGKRVLQTLTIQYIRIAASDAVVILDAKQSNT